MKEEKKGQDERGQKLVENQDFYLDSIPGVLVCQWAGYCPTGLVLCVGHRGSVKNTWAEGQPL